MKLNAKNCLIKDNKRIQQWRDILVKTVGKANENNILNSGEDYTDEQIEDCQLFFTDCSMVGCYVAVFFKKSLSSKLKQKSLALCRVKVGVKGTAGNKGAVCIRFQIADQTMMIINCHLASGKMKDNERIKQLSTIFKTAFQNNLRNRGMTMENHQQVLLMGDLNFRIRDLDRDQVIEACKLGKLS